MGWLDDALIRRVETDSLTMVLLLRNGAKANESRVLTTLLLSEIWVVLHFRQHLIAGDVSLEVAR